MKILVTGGCGFLGSTLASSCLDKKWDVAVVDNLSRFGSKSNLEWLRSRGLNSFYQQDVSDANGIAEIVKTVKPEAVFHLAGQVAMTTSIEDPRKDFSTNTIGTFNVLEALRLHSPSASFIYSSTNKVYGDLEDMTYRETPTRYECEQAPRGFNESLRLQFASPYGCSKGAADQYVLDYARIYGLNTVVFRHSSIFGTRQFSTFDQGWVGWFVGEFLKRKASINALKEEITIAGNGKQVRDVLFAGDLVTCYHSALANISKVRGEAFNIGGGIENSISILELFQWLGQYLEVRVNVKHLAPRSSDQKFFVADIAKAEKKFGWKPTINREQGLSKMVAWVRETQKQTKTQGS